MHVIVMSLYNSYFNFCVCADFKRAVVIFGVSVDDAEDNSYFNVCACLRRVVVIFGASVHDTFNVFVRVAVET